MTRQVIISAEEKERGNRALHNLKKVVNHFGETLRHPPSACVITFGCQMNARDSEKLTGILESAGFEVTEDEYAADFVLYNTCTVRENADNRLYGRLGRLSAEKKKKPLMKIAVCGCMMQEDTAVEKLRKSYPYVNLIFGTFNIHRFAELLLAMFSSERMIVDIWKEAGEVTEDLPVLRKYPFKSGVNIMYGCDNFCSYCIVPYVRGRERSRTSADILSEVRRLADDGVKEVMLLGQNVNSYGKGLADDILFPELLQKVCRVDGIERVRFMTSHPKDLSDDLIRVMSTEETCARHIHLAMQSGSNRILEMMNRHYTKEEFLRLTDKIKNADPDISITTDIIVGFPTETYADVKETVDVIEKAGFDNAFTFIYSRRSGTPAAKYPLPDDKNEIQKHFDEVLLAVQETAHKHAERFVGRTMRALVEGVNTQDSSLMTGRLSSNSLVHFRGDPNMTGSFVDVVLDDSHGFYYSGHKI